MRRSWRRAPCVPCRRRLRAWRGRLCPSRRACIRGWAARSGCWAPVRTQPRHPVQLVSVVLASLGSVISFMYSHTDADGLRMNGSLGVQSAAYRKFAISNMHACAPAPLQEHCRRRVCPTLVLL